MHDFDPVEIRVIGCLLEKQRTTPDGYPLSLNALRTACNQATNREPVVDYDEATVRRALGSLGERRWIRSATGHGGRAIRYRHLTPDRLGLPEPQLSLLAVLMLRGPQTPGELKQRVERLCAFADLPAVQEALEGLIEAGLVARLERRPGQKEERYAHLLSADSDAGEAETGAAPVPGSAPAPAPAGPQAVPAADRVDSAVARLEGQIATLSERIEALERQAGLQRPGE